jgi:hypothetical protein
MNEIIESLPFYEIVINFFETIIPIRSGIDWLYNWLNEQSFLMLLWITIGFLAVSAVGLYHWLKLFTKIAMIFLVFVALWWVFTSGILLEIFGS